MENSVVETTGEQRPLSLIRLAVLLSTHLLWPSEQVSGKVTLAEQKSGSTADHFHVIVLTLNTH